MMNDMHYLNLLSQSFPTIADAAKEIINLEAILNLPKGTEHFLADIHGENEAFEHVLKNASGNIKRKVSEIFGNSIRESEKKELCTLIYYPEQKLELIKATEDPISLTSSQHTKLPLMVNSVESIVLENHLRMIRQAAQCVRQVFLFSKDFTLSSSNIQEMRMVIS